MGSSLPLLVHSPKTPVVYTRQLALRTREKSGLSCGRIGAEGWLSAGPGSWFASSALQELANALEEVRLNLVRNRVCRAKRQRKARVRMNSNKSTLCHSTVRWAGSLSFIFTAPTRGDDLDQLVDRDPLQALRTNHLCETPTHA